jgi:hypothetical protein
MRSNDVSKWLPFIDRRSLLNFMGLSAGGLFLPSLMGDRAARAAEPPRRIWIFYTQHGPHYPLWKMRQGGGDDVNQDWEIPLANLAQSAWSHSLAPLYAHRNDVLIVDGLANAVGLVDDPGRNNAHDIGNGTILTGAHIVAGGGDNRGGGPSIDQVISKSVAQPGKRATIYATTWGAWTPIFSGPGKPIKGINEPRPLFDSLAGLVPPGTGAGTGPDPLAQARASLPDLVREDYKAALKKVGRDDRLKLEEHVGLIDSLQKQLQGRLTQGGSMTGGTCTLGARPGGVVHHAENAMGSAKVLTAALACDLTRVAVQVHGQFAPAEFGASAGDVHQDIAHQATDGTAAAMGMANYYRKHAEQFAQILSGLKAVQVDGGKTLLDSTAVVWVTELANGPHDLHRVPFVIGGSCGGYFKTGRYLKYAETATVNGRRSGPAHNKFLVSLMRAMGLPDNSIGPTSAGGASLTGALPRLAVSG